MCQMQKNAFRVSEKSIADAEWLKDLKRERVNDECPQKRVSINVEKIRKQYRKIPNWNTPGRNVVQGYWIKNLSSLH